LTIITDGINYTKLFCDAPEKDVDGGSSNGFLAACGSLAVPK